MLLMRLLKMLQIVVLCDNRGSRCALRLVVEVVVVIVDYFPHEQSLQVQPEPQEQLPEVQPPMVMFDCWGCEEASPKVGGWFGGWGVIVWQS